jgi:hypothetical protein
MTSPLADELSRAPGLAALDDLFWQMIQWRPAADSRYFEVLAERVAYHRYGVNVVALRWPGRR